MTEKFTDVGKTTEVVDIPFTTMSQMGSQALLEAMGEPIKGRTLLSDGWVYRDFPFRVTYEVWDQFLEILGEAETDYVILAYSEGPDWRRGQFLISPQAMKRLED